MNTKNEMWPTTNSDGSDNGNCFIRYIPGVLASQNVEDGEDDVESDSDIEDDGNGTVDDFHSFGD